MFRCMNKYQKICMLIYNSTILIAGILFVPIKKVLKGQVYDSIYAPIWKLKENVKFDNYYYIYQLDKERFFATFFIITIFFLIICIILKEN